MIENTYFSAMYARYVRCMKIWTSWTFTLQTRQIKIRKKLQNITCLTKRYSITRIRGKWFVSFAVAANVPPALWIIMSFINVLFLSLSEEKWRFRATENFKFIFANWSMAGFERVLLKATQWELEIFYKSMNNVVHSTPSQCFFCAVIRLDYRTQNKYFP